MDERKSDIDVNPEYARQQPVSDPEANEMKAEGHRKVETPINDGAPDANIPALGNTAGRARGSAQLGTVGRGSQVGSVDDVTDDD